MNRFAIGEMVHLPRPNKYPSNRLYVVVAYEKKGDSFVYHLAAYNFDTTGFNTQSHVAENLLTKA